MAGRDLIMLWCGSLYPSLSMPSSHFGNARTHKNFEQDELLIWFCKRDLTH